MKEVKLKVKWGCQVCIFTCFVLWGRLQFFVSCISSENKESWDFWVCKKEKKKKGPKFSCFVPACLWFIYYTVFFNDLIVKECFNNLNLVSIAFLVGIGNFGIFDLLSSTVQLPNYTIL